MPRDVSTRWNSTFDMLDFAISYREAIDALTANRLLKLRRFELDNEEWEVAERLRDTLQVWFTFFKSFF
jgi:collagenase-like PrtC family protease